MNQIKLKGVLRNIQPSHRIKDVDYDKSDLIVTRKDGKQDVLSLRYKRFANPYQEDQEISIVGNIRSYSRQEDGRNKVDVYVFTYFDQPELDSNDQEVVNEFEVDGRICKIEELRSVSKGKQNIHFILANNLIIEDSNQKLNSYLPCIAWGSVAKEIAKCNVNDVLNIHGEFHSREYRKILPSGEMEIRVAHELVVTSFEKIEQ